MSFDSGFSCSFPPVIWGPELQILWKLVTFQLTSTEHMKYTQIKFRSLYKNRCGCMSAFEWFYHQVKLFFPSQAVWKCISSSSHFTWFYKVSLSYYDQNLLEAVFKDTRSSSKLPHWKKNTPGFTWCPDKGYASSFSKPSLFLNPNPPLCFDVLTPILSLSSPQADLSLSESLLPLRMITLFLFSGHLNTDKKLKLKRLAN